MIKVDESFSNDSTASIYTGARVNLQGDNFSLRADVPTDEGFLEEYRDFMEDFICRNIGSKREIISLKIHSSTSINTCSRIV
jgi:hypothetical protein